MVLHTLNTAPDHPAFSHCLRLLAGGDALLLHGDGVYAAITGAPALEALCQAGAELHVLAPDARAAGVLERLDPRVQAVDYAGFVALSERFSRQQAWY
ncbi:MAG: sulfurtransferase complex subunit TusB [Parahaliea sp.]